MLYMENTEQRGTGIENGSEWSNGTVNFDRTGPTVKSGPPRKVDRIFRNFSGWTEPIHSVLDRNFRKFWLNGSCPRRTIGKSLGLREHKTKLCNEGNVPERKFTQREGYKYKSGRRTADLQAETTGTSICQGFVF